MFVTTGMTLANMLSQRRQTQKAKECMSPPIRNRTDTSTETGSRVAAAGLGVGGEEWGVIADRCGPSSLR